MYTYCSCQYFCSLCGLDYSKSPLDLTLGIATFCSINLLIAIDSGELGSMSAMAGFPILWRRRSSLLAALSSLLSALLSAGVSGKALANPPERLSAWVSSRIEKKVVSVLFIFFVGLFA